VLTFATLRVEYCGGYVIRLLRARRIFSVRHISIRIAVAALAFVLGTAAHTMWVGVHGYKAADIPDLRQSLVEDWHRLHEAAELSGDPALRNLLHDRLLCTNSTGVSDAWLVEIETGQGCRDADGTVHELRLYAASEYGSFSEEITSTHSKWVFENMEFVASISTASSAKQYLLSHY